MIEETTNQSNIEPVIPQKKERVFSKLTAKFAPISSKVSQSSVFAQLKTSKLKINYKLLGTILGGAALVYAVYAAKGLVIAAFVNGKVVTRYDVTKETERRAGEAILEGLVNQNLINQEAKALKLEVTQQEIESDISKLRTSLSSQGTTLEDMLKQQNLTLPAFKRILYTNKQLEKLIEKRIAVTDEEVNKYIEDNKGSIPEGQDKEALKPQILNMLQQQKIDTETQKLLAELRAKAKIVYWVRF